MSMITDITDFEGILSPRSTAPAPAKKLARFLGSIVQAATAWPPDDVLESAIHCHRKPRRKACPGRIRLIRHENDQNGPSNDVGIVWDCPVCQDVGVIRNWAGTEWDLSDNERDPDWWDSETLHLDLTDLEYLALREELKNNKRLFVLVIVAAASENGPIMEITMGETHLLIEGVFQAMKVASGRRKNVLESVMNKLHQVMVGKGSIQ